MAYKNLKNYHEKIRYASGGRDITEENKPENSKTLHIRVPLRVYMELSLLASKKDVKVGRAAIEVLVAWTNHQVRKRNEAHSKPVSSELMDLLADEN